MEGVTSAAVTQPRAESRRTKAPAARRSLAAALLLGALGAAVALLASRQTWAEGDAATAGGALHQIAKGSDVTGVPAALAIVGLAALVAVFAVRRTGRVLVSALLALSGAGTIAAALLGAQDPAALDEKAATASGQAGATIDAVTFTPWPFVAAAGGLLLLLAGVLALRFGASWPAMSGKYERGTGHGKATRTDPDRPEDLWKALDRGEDPTN
ncbi:TIGR02234 family membrane protein [Streptomyces sp. B-S-A8]|uniref:TIGR02234 family membrane protein n=1 Tax=Streptomyces solicavernae TaxID=3043614 RepID=A0ABT6RZA1_9ACTN|nr:TIGR02234 family membrane protein [Streptomyces sp. B-S-A8]MDI3389761.1 TIGR02234 family membrane protein [Streptomyces sp. B-S-A8]